MSEHLKTGTLRRRSDADTVKFMPKPSRWITVFVLSVLALAAQERAGRFSGTWNSLNTEASGTIKMDLKAGPEAIQNSVVTFTISGYEVKTTIKSVKLEADKIDVAYSFDLNGTSLISTVSGRISDGKLEGKYVTTTPDGGQADSGIVKAVVTK
jgi:hypothetical protein